VNCLVNILPTDDAHNCIETLLAIKSSQEETISLLVSTGARLNGQNEGLKQELAVERRTNAVQRGKIALLKSWCQTLGMTWFR
jgi:hypothetical protein